MQVKLIVVVVVVVVVVIVSYSLLESSSGGSGHSLCISYLSVFNLINSVPANVYNAHVYANYFVCGSDQLESLSYFGHCAHLLFATSAIHFAYVFFSL